MNKNVLRVALRAAWIVLVVCFVIKVLGGDWFDIMIDEGVGSAIDESLALSIMICSVTSYTLFNFYYLAICERRNFKVWVHLVLVPYFVGVSTLKMFIDARFHILIDLVSAFGVSLLLVRFTNKKYFRIVIAFVLNCGFQSISVMIRNLSFVAISQGSLVVELILSFDVTIMLVLYYLHALYRNIDKKEVKKDE